jgi:hypothetical protein
MFTRAHCAPRCFKVLISKVRLQQLQDLGVFINYSLKTTDSSRLAYM